MNTAKHKNQVHRGDWLYLGLGFLIPVLVTLVGYIVIKVWPFGDGTVLIIDSIHQYLPFYTEFHEKLTTGQSLFFDFSGGFGYDFWATYAYYLASPLNFLIVLVKKANVADFMDYMIMFKIGLCGGTFAWYLRRRDRSAKFLPVVFAVMYAMGNFIIGYYFNLMWLDSIAMLPLIMEGLEKLTAGKSGKEYGLALAYAIYTNYYIGFMLCIFSVLYLLVCYLTREGITLHQFVKRTAAFAVYSLLGGGMGAVVLLPAYASLSASEAMQSNNFPRMIKWYVDFIDLMQAHFAANNPINISSTQVGLNAYCGVAVFMLVILYVLDHKVGWKEKLGHLVLIGFLLLSFSLNVLSYMWHGFHLQNGLPNRFAFIYVVLVLKVSYDSLRHIKDAALWKIFLAGVLSIGFSLIVILMGRTDMTTFGNWVFITPLLLCIYLVLLVGAKVSPLKQSTAGILVGVVLLAEAVSHGIFGFRYNENVIRSIYLADQASWQKMVPAQGDEDFFRSEIDSQRMRNVTMYAGGNSTVMFNSTMQESVTNFCDKIGMEARTNKNGYIGVTSLMNDVFGIRYVLSSNGKGDRLYQMEKIDSDGNLSLYKNDNALPIGFMVNPELRYWDTSAGTPAEVQNKFVNLATGQEDIFTLDRTIDVVDGESYDIKVPENKQVYIYLPSRVSSITVTTPEYTKTYTTYTDHMYVINRLGDSDIAQVKIDLNEGQAGQQLYVYTCPDAAEEEVVSALAESPLNAEVVGNKLTGTVNAKKDGILMITIPWDQNWEVEVDGEAVTPLKIGSCLTGIELKAGEHQIRMKYTPGGFYKGLLLSLLSLAAFGLFALWEGRRKAMHLHFSRKADSFKPGIFAILNDKKETLLEEGRTVYNLSVGTPDFKPSQRVMDAVSDAARKPENYRYSLKEMPELIEAMQNFYQRRFGVNLEANEIMSVYGSQEGMAHIAWALCDPGDLVLVPNPGYPIFKIGPELCGAKTWEYPLTEENDYLPDLQAIPEDVRAAARFMIVNYPGNPLCKCAPDSFYEELITFARENNIIIVHDNAYSDIIYGGREGKSFLAFEGAKEVGVEFYSLSKSFDYTGARMSFLVGNAQIIEKFNTIRSQFDYGIFYPVQYGAIAALTEPEEGVKKQCANYEERMRTLCQGLRDIGWDVPDSDGTMFVWAPLPKGFHNSEAFCLGLMDRAGVICTPGSSFGSLGEGYVRFALVLPPEELKKCVAAIDKSGILKGITNDK